jgi:DNA-directed RNA polymerase subunit RPC12/RpoP
MTAESRAWIEAGITLGRDPTAKVRCPVCDADFLTVRDVDPEPPSDQLERYLVCPSCKSRNILRMRRSPSEP